MEISSRRWNHNIQYHPLILRAVPKGARSALDVGCGDGLLTSELRRVVPDVIGIDLDETVLATARQYNDELTWIHGDAMTFAFDRQFDVVASIATLHHMPDLGKALARLADLTAPGGVLVIVGMAQTSRPRDAILHLAGIVQHRWMTHKYGFWEHTAPVVWPPPHDYVTVRKTAERVLPGVHWKQLLLWRYALVWNKPR
ncbi:class I SAM-dependent methyltransferase [Devriesea agamarum]|uniref:class I SAM-dependent methyltransferase n=1 Tax=Devriesea agamarum TaxID=472569 RepID=UPI00071DB8F8|nr:class I SAM-dependent methyltransferase [Devriesea agamarum]